MHVQALTTTIRVVKSRRTRSILLTTFLFNVYKRFLSRFYVFNVFLIFISTFLHLWFSVMSISYQGSVNLIRDACARRYDSDICCRKMVIIEHFAAANS